MYTGLRSHFGWEYLQYSKYLDILCRAAGGRFSVLVARYGEELAGGVALYEQDTRFGMHVSPRRLLSYNGVVLRRYDTRHHSQQTVCERLYP